MNFRNTKYFNSQAVASSIPRQSKVFAPEKTFKRTTREEKIKCNDEKEIMFSFRGGSQVFQ